MPMTLATPFTRGKNSTWLFVNQTEWEDEVDLFWTTYLMLLLVYERPCEDSYSVVLDPGLRPNSCQGVEWILEGMSLSILVCASS